MSGSYAQGSSSSHIDRGLPPASASARDHRTWVEGRVTDLTPISVAVGKDEQGRLTGTFEVYIQETRRKIGITLPCFSLSLAQVPTTIWWQPEKRVLKQYLEEAFSLSGTLLADGTIWGERGPSMKSRISAKIMTIVKEAYNRYLTDDMCRISVWPGANQADMSPGRDVNQVLGESSDANGSQQSGVRQP
jgi:hypothetical protein